MNQDIIELIKSQIVDDYEKEIEYYKALANVYRVISNVKGTISDSWQEETLIDYVISLPDGYNKENNGVLNKIEDIVDHMIEKWKYHGCHLDKVEKYEKVMF